LKPVKKFTNRQTAIERIWNAVQRLARGSGETNVPITQVRDAASGASPIRRDASMRMPTKRKLGRKRRR